MTPDGCLAVSGSDDMTVRVWDLARGQCLRTLEGHHNWIGSVNVTPDGRRAVVGNGGPLGGTSGTLRLWDLEVGRCLRVFEGHSGQISSVTVTSDGYRAVSGSGDNTLRLWDLETGACLRTFTGHSAKVTSVGVTPDGWHAFSGSADETVRVWDVESGACMTVLDCSSAVTAVAVAGRGHVICAGTQGGEVLFLELHGVPFGPAILTAANPQQARCPVCGQEFVPPPGVVVAIQDGGQGSPTLAEGFGVQDTSIIHRPPATSSRASSAFLSSCPHCQHPLKFNPFFSAAEDYADVLRRGLEYSRREKGPDHEEILAHLTAMAVHLAANGKPDEACEYKREHDEIAARVAGKRKDVSP
jgi:hypothetical protein